MEKVNTHFKGTFFFSDYIKLTKNFAIEQLLKKKFNKNFATKLLLRKQA